MKDKIQEIMGLVDEYKDVAIGGFSGWEERMVIESKLRELVREPLGDEDVLSIQERYVGGVCPQYPLDASDWINFARAIEAAHGITNTSGVE